MKKISKMFLLSVFLLGIVSCNKKDESNNFSSSSVGNSQMVDSIYDSLDTTISSNEDSSITSSDNSLSSSSDFIPNRKINVYINPSVQIHNLYVNNLGNEAEHMFDIASLMVNNLKDINYLNVNYNLRYLSLSESIKESNNLNTHIHLSLHSNAGGGNGSELYTNSMSNSFAQHLYNDYTLAIGSFKKRGIKLGNTLMEIKNVKAENRVLLELLFHDNLQEATYIIENKEKISKILSDSICSYVKKFYFNIY